MRIGAFTGSTGGFLGILGGGLGVRRMRFFMRLVIRLGGGCLVVFGFWMMMMLLEQRGVRRAWRRGLVRLRLGGVESGSSFFLLGSFVSCKV
ncbi:hypothetical protein QBC44DRAFT_323737 [Cladorrhinum sp. PSN332]|nr:hypothetical protein QBC44DRAFT_323737 [Cladorrhinum sp. PSN332]